MALHLQGRAVGPPEALYEPGGSPRSRGPVGARRSRRLLNLRDTARAMSQENAELIRFGYDALNRRDYEAWISTLHPDVELHELPTNPDATVFKGRDQVREWTRSVFEVAREGSRFDPERFEELGRFVLVRLRAVLFARERAVAV